VGKKSCTNANQKNLAQQNSWGVRRLKKKTEKKKGEGAATQFNTSRAEKLRVMQKERFPGGGKKGRDQSGPRKLSRNKRLRVGEIAVRGRRQAAGKKSATCWWKEKRKEGTPSYTLTLKKSRA